LTPFPRTAKLLCKGSTVGISLLSPRSSAPGSSSSDS
jgi:hypothetical protein